MDMRKYKDMAYLNNKGKQWIDKLLRPEIWNIWVKKLRLRGDIDESEDSYENYAHRVVAEAVWYLGYLEGRGINNTAKMHEVCKRLRKSKGCIFSNDVRIYRLPWEFIEFDAFLENYIRDLL